MRTWHRVINDNLLSSWVGVMEEEVTELKNLTHSAVDVGVKTKVEDQQRALSLTLRTRTNQRAGRVTQWRSVFVSRDTQIESSSHPSHRATARWGGGTGVWGVTLDKKNSSGTDCQRSAVSAIGGHNSSERKPPTASSHSNI
ncbi:hypothetical protein BY996DRAFT_6413079 [Phakopsora pachyrhizi]|nr:hypothetical protein BY996DRAFT_6413079 [Phakopsora pachyrhizi]